MGITKKQWRFIVSGIFLILVFIFFAPKFFNKTLAVDSTPPFPTPTIIGPTVTSTTITPPPTTPAPTRTSTPSRINCGQQCKVKSGHTGILGYFEGLALSLNPNTWIIQNFCETTCMMHNFLLEYAAWMKDTIDKQDVVSVDLKGNIDRVHLENAWKFILSLVNYVVVAFLIFIAFVNILRINVDVYAIKKALPNVIIGVILANLSWLICMEFVTLADILTNWINYLSGVVSGSNVNNVFFNSFVTLFEPIVPETPNNAFTLGSLFTILMPGVAMGAAAIASLVAVIVGALVAGFALVLSTIVMFLLIVRLYAVMLLIVAAPLAFVAMSTPLTNKMFQQWWRQFMCWIFMAPLAYLIWLVAIFISKGIGSGAAGSPGGGGAAAQVAKYILICAAFYFSMKIPFALGGGAIAGWASLGKRGAAYLGRASDKAIGDFTAKSFKRRISPMTLYTGYVQGAQKSWEAHKTAGSAAAEELREGFVHLPGQGIKKLGGSKESLWYTPTTGGQGVRAVVKESVEQGKRFADENTPDNVASAFEKATGGKDGKGRVNTTEAEKYLVAKIVQGTATDDDFSRFLTTDAIYRKTNGQEISEANAQRINEAVSENQNRANQGTLAPDGQRIFNPYHKDANKYVKVASQDLEDQQFKALNRQYGHPDTRASALADAASILTEGVANKKTDSPQFRAAQAFLSDINSTDIGKQRIAEISPSAQAKINALVAQGIVSSNFASNKTAPVNFSPEATGIVMGKNRVNQALINHFGADYAEEMKKDLEESIDQHGGIDLGDMETKIKGKLSAVPDLETRFENMKPELEKAISEINTKVGEMKSAIPNIDEHLSNIDNLKMDVKRNAKVIVNLHDNFDLVKGNVEENISHQMDKILSQCKNTAAVKKAIENRLARDIDKIDVNQTILADIKANLKVGDTKTVEDNLNRYKFAKLKERSLNVFRNDFKDQIDKIREEAEKLKNQP